jgi:aminopeptidase N
LFCLVALSGALLPARTARADFEFIECRGSRGFAAPPDSPDRRKYAPSREIDILHLALDVTPDFRQRTLSGKVTIRFKPIAKPFAELKLDGIDLTVGSVTSTETILGWQGTDKNVIVTFEPPIPTDKEASVTISYSAEPKKGLYFRTPEMGYKPEDEHLWSQGEAIEARHWFPCWDSPNEKFTSEVTCRVPEGMVVLSNGKRMSEEKEPGTGRVAVRWLQDKPHVNYLICLCAGYFKKVEDKYKDVPLAFWVPASQIGQAAESFKHTKDVMAFFEEEIGVPYPWAKYDQVVVDDFVMGGMENTSITVLTDGTLHTAASENLRDSQGLVAHEMAHQWFGDLVTCKDWSHIWLNEGFATYYDQLYDGHKRGRDQLLYNMYSAAKGIIVIANQTNSVVHRDYNSPDDVFGFLAYPKGSWLLHMLRNQLGGELYRRCIKTYVERHKFGNVVTEDLNQVIEELSGRSFDQFFDQWAYHASHPELTVNYVWDERSKLAKISIQQNQKLSDDVLLFNFPLTIRFKSKSGTVDKVITVKEKAEDFYIPLAQAPEIVRVDPDVAVLAKITFNPPAAMLDAQLKDKSDTLGRLLAVEQLGARKDGTAVAKLKEALNNDSFYAVRTAAAQALRAINTDAAYEALLASVQQGDARVRRQVVADIGGFYRETSYAAAQKVLKDEKNPDIVATAIASLGAYAKPEVRRTLLDYLNGDSYRNSLAESSITAIRGQDDAGYVEPLQECLQKREAKFTTSGFARALETLAWLARNQEKKDSVREFLADHVNSKKKRVQLAALGALGTLGDARAIALLEKFTGAAKESPERTAAERSLNTLRDTKKPSAEMGGLRNEVLNLQKENRDLHKEFDDLKKKVEAAMPKTATKPAETTKPVKPVRK